MINSGFPYFLEARFTDHYSQRRIVINRVNFYGEVSPESKWPAKSFVIVEIKADLFLHISVSSDLYHCWLLSFD